TFQEVFFAKACGIIRHWGCARLSLSQLIPSIIRPRVEARAGHVATLLQPRQIGVCELDQK
ncbi:MAG: hypothetical protein P8X69_12155, partial [Maritimibacter sp.]